jgi:ABC-2 type transport system permease protein
VGLFFTFAMPLLIVLLLGLAFQGAENVGVGVLDDSQGPASQALVHGLEEAPGLTVRSYRDADALDTAVTRSEVGGGVYVPPDYDETLASGDQATVQLLLDSVSGDAAAVRAQVQEVIDRQSGLVLAARAAQQAAELDLASGLELAAQAASAAALVEVQVTATGTGIAAGLSIRDYAVIGQLVLFLFLIALTGAGDMAESRRLGVSRRMLATPTTAGAVIGGEGLGRYGIAGLQAVAIIVGTALLFAVDWVNLPAVLAVVAVYALVATGAGLLVGAVASSAQQAGAIGPVVGITLGFLGGCTWPLELVPEPMQVAAHLTPQAWAMDALTGIVGEGRSLAEVMVPVAVLLGFAAVLLPVSAWRLLRALRP